MCCCCRCVCVCVCCYRCVCSLPTLSSVGAVWAGRRRQQGLGARTKLHVARGVMNTTTPLRVSLRCMCQCLCVGTGVWAYTPVCVSSANSVCPTVFAAHIRAPTVLETIAQSPSNTRNTNLVLNIIYKPLSTGPPTRAHRSIVRCQRIIHALSTHPLYTPC